MCVCVWCVCVCVLCVEWCTVYLGPCDVCTVLVKVRCHCDTMNLFVQCW